MDKETTQDGTAVSPVIDEQALWEKAKKDSASTPAEGSHVAQGGPQGEDQAVAADPLANLPEPTRKLIEQIQAKTVEQDTALKDVGQKLARAHGTIGNLTAKLNESLKTLTAIQPVVESVQAQEKAAADVKAAERETQRKERRERLSDLPDVLEELDDIRADAKPAAEAKPAPKTADTVIVESAAPKETPEEMEVRLTKERELSDLHPKWIETVKSEEFKVWAKAQPAAIQSLGASDDIADAAKMLDAYKKHKEDSAKVAKVEADRQARLRRGETVQGSGTAQSGEAPTPDALWEQAKRDREKARARA